MSRHRFAPVPGVVGLHRCTCGAQCMVVARISGVVATLRAFSLYRYPLLTNATKTPNGLIRAKGWSAWSTVKPGHVTPTARARGHK